MRVHSPHLEGMLFEPLAVAVVQFLGGEAETRLRQHGTRVLRLPEMEHLPMLVASRGSVPRSPSACRAVSVSPSESASPRTVSHSSTRLPALATEPICTRERPWSTSEWKPEVSPNTSPPAS